jgi:hypothetical protein
MPLDSFSLHASLAANVKLTSRIHIIGAVRRTTEINKRKSALFLCYRRSEWDSVPLTQASFFLMDRCANSKTFKRFSPYELDAVTVPSAKGADVMKNRETYFEQVPIEVAETVLRQAAEEATLPERSPAETSPQEPRSAAEPLQRSESVPSKGRL